MPLKESVESYIPLHQDRFCLCSPFGTFGTFGGLDNKTVCVLLYCCLLLDCILLFAVGLYIVVCCWIVYCCLLLDCILLFAVGLYIVVCCGVVCRLLLDYTYSLWTAYRLSLIKSYIFLDNYYILSINYIIPNYLTQYITYDQKHICF